MRVRVTAISDNANAVHSRFKEQAAPCCRQSVCVTGTQETAEQAARDMENL